MKPTVRSLSFSAGAEPQPVRPTARPATRTVTERAASRRDQLTFAMRKSFEEEGRFQGRGRGPGGAAEGDACCRNLSQPPESVMSRARRGGQGSHQKPLYQFAASIFPL